MAVNVHPQSNMSLMKKVCRLVGFCGPEHAHLHRPEQFCFPFMVEMREGVGRLVLRIDCGELGREHDKLQISSDMLVLK